MRNKPAYDVKDLTKSRTAFYLDHTKVLSQLRLVPNIISLARILMILPIWILYANPAPAAHWATLILLVLSYLSDYADGVAARKLGQTSPLGLILDPVADKLWTLVTMILLVKYREFQIWMALVIVGRDVVIGLLNAPLLRRVGTVFSSDFFGKLYMILLGLMVIGYTLNLNQSIYIFYSLLPLAAITLAKYTWRISDAIRMANRAIINK